MVALPSYGRRPRGITVTLLSVSDYARKDIEKSKTCSKQESRNNKRLLD